MPLKEVRPSLLISLVNGVACCFVPSLYGFGTPFFYFAVELSALQWVVLLCAALILFRKQGLWLLLTAPVNLFYPLLYILLAVACYLSTDGCL